MLSSPTWALASKRLSSRRVGHIFDDAAERVRTVQRALRSAQHLDAFDVEGVEIAGQDSAIGKASALPEWDVVQVHRDGRPDAPGVDAAQDDPRFAGEVLP